MDSWQRSGLPAKDFAPLVGLSDAWLYKWRRRFEQHGPAGLEDKLRGASGGSKLDEVTRRAILLTKEVHPDWGQDRIYNELRRTEALHASPGAIAKLLIEEGYVVEEVKKPSRREKPRRFERARPNQLWQTDLFTFTLKRQNRRVHLIGFMDDHSRFVVGFGLHASSAASLVREVFESAIANYGAPEEVLTDNGAQYVTWRGQSKFSKLCDRRGIKHVVARPQHPQTLGKIERFWKTLWNDCVSTAVFVDLEDARKRIGHFVDYYNFRRTHQGIEGLVPADRFFGAASEVKDTLAKRVVENALELAKDGIPRKDFYLTGRVGDVGISLHAEGEKVILTSEDGNREAVNLSATGRRSNAGPVDLPEPVTAEPSLELPLPGTSPLDAALSDLDEEGLSEADQGSAE